MKPQELYTFPLHDRDPLPRPEFEGTAEWRKRKQQEKDPETVRYLESFLSRVHHDTIQKSIQRIITRSGLAADAVQLVPPEEVIPADLSIEAPDLVGTYYLSGHYIALNTSLLKTQADLFARKNPDVPTSQAQDLLLLHSLVHEQTHAASYRQWLRDREADNEIHGGVTGYQIHSQHPAGGADLYSSFDEGLTELIARRITTEYLDANPDFVSPESKQKFLAATQSQDIFSSYQYEITLIHTLVETLARQTKMSPDTIEQAIIRGKFEGTDLRNPTLSRFLDEHTFPEFSQMLQNLTTESGSPHKILRCVQELTHHNTQSA